MIETSDVVVRIEVTVILDFTLVPVTDEMALGTD